MRKTMAALLAGTAVAAMTPAAMAADLLVTPPPAVGVVYDDAPVGAWDGMYVGVFGGWGNGFADHTNGAAPSPCAGFGNPDGCDLTMTGWLLGATAGANFSTGSGIVFGVAGDIAWSNVGARETFALGAPFGDTDLGNTVNWEGSLRGVLGYDAGMFMPYLTAGLAVANASHYSGFGDTTADATHFGFTGGAGVQVAVADNVALDLQYRASVYDEQEYDHGAAPNNPVFGLMTQRVTAGLNFRF